MRMDSSVSTSEIETRLRIQAEDVYGPERAGELSEQIAHIALMMAELARRELEIVETTPLPVGFPKGDRS